MGTRRAPARYFRSAAPVSIESFRTPATFPRMRYRIPSLRAALLLIILNALSRDEHETYPIHLATLNFRAIAWRTNLCTNPAQYPRTKHFSSLASVAASDRVF